MGTDLYASRSSNQVKTFEIKVSFQIKFDFRVDKKRDKVERNVLDSQERAFWDVYRPAPGCVNMSEHDIKKLMRRKASFLSSHSLAYGQRKSSTTSATNTAPASALAFAANKNLMTMTVGLLSPGPLSQLPSSTTTSTLRECDETALIDQLYHEIEFLKHRIDRRCLKTSKVCETYVSYFEQYAEFDPFMTPCEPSNPCKRIYFYNLPIKSLDFFLSKKTSERRSNVCNLSVQGFF